MSKASSSSSLGDTGSSLRENGGPSEKVTPCASNCSRSSSLPWSYICDMVDDPLLRNEGGCATLRISSHYRVMCIIFLMGPLCQSVCLEFIRWTSYLFKELSLGDT